MAEDSFVLIKDPKQGVAWYYRPGKDPVIFFLSFVMGVVRCDILRLMMNTKTNRYIFNVAEKNDDCATY